MRGSVSLVAIALIAAASAGAAPLALLETSDYGGNQAAPTPVGTLDVGVNTIAGSLDPADEAPGAGDTIAVELPAGLEIQAIRLDIEGYPPSPPPPGFTDVDVFAVPFALLDNLQVFADGAYPLTVAVPITEPGSYGLSLQNAALGIAAFDWTWTVDVVAPEPENGAGAGAACALLLAWRARASRRRGSSRSSPATPASVAAGAASTRR